MPDWSPPAALEGFTKSTFAGEGKTRDVFRIGSGPAALVIAEIPGITPLVVDFARRVAAIGCTAVVPHLFGDPGRPPTPAYIAQTAGWVCVSREFSTFAKRRTSPVTTWLRALATQVHGECGGPGVGVVGMCLTGGFALAMMVDEVVLAPVLSQPSLPFTLSAAHRRDLGISDDDLETVKGRCAGGATVVGLRFSGDKLAPADRFARLREELGDAFVAVEIDSSPGNAEGYRKGAHSVLTEDLKDVEGSASRDALDLVLDLFRTKLLVES